MMRYRNVARKVWAVTVLSFMLTALSASLADAQTNDFCKPDPATGKVSPSCEYVSLTTIPGATEAGKTSNPVVVIRNVYGVSIGIAAILAVGMIIWAGVEYATTESITGHSDAKEKWMGAAVGLTLLLASYLILRTINADLVNINLDLGAPKVGEKTSANPLADVQKAATDSANAYQVADKNNSATIKNAETTLTDLKSQRQKLSDSLQKFSDPSKLTDAQKAERDQLNKQIADIDAGIKQQEQTITDAKIATIQAKFNTTFAQGKYQVQRDLNSTVENGGGPRAAAERANATLAVYDTDIQALKDAGASDAVVKKAEVSREGIKDQLDIILITGQQLRSIVGGVYAAGMSDDNVRDVVTQKYNELKAKDPAVADSFKTAADQETKKMQDLRDKMKSCKNGYKTVPSGMDVTCI